MNESEFESRADTELHELLEAVIACSELVDPDLQSGVLTINFDDDTKYVVNSHRAAKQIWMAAERAAWHFDYDPSADKWLANQKEDELWATLSGVLSRKLDESIELSK
jgi:CyaY protein